jgi:predicted HTH transcriptional regulator
MVALHVYQANDSDITKAIDIWDNLIYSRKQLYELRDTKEIKTTTELILELISKTEEISTRELRDKVVALNICSEASLYRNIERLIRIGKIKYKGKSTENAKIEILESKHL